jgi:hypothetical protein
MAVNTEKLTKKPHHTGRRGSLVCAATPTGCKIPNVGSPNGKPSMDCSGAVGVRFTGAPNVQVEWTSRSN